MLAGRGTARNYGRNSNSPATGYQRTSRPEDSEFSDYLESVVRNVFGFCGTQRSVDWDYKRKSSRAQIIVDPF